MSHHSVSTWSVCIFFGKKCSITTSFCVCLMVKVRLTCLCWICFTAYKCRCTRKGPKIRYKDVQKLEIKPKHPYCQEKMILWVWLLFPLFSFHILHTIFSPSRPLPFFSPCASLPDTHIYNCGCAVTVLRNTVEIFGSCSAVIKTSCRLCLKHLGGFTAW